MPELILPDGRTAHYWLGGATDGPATILRYGAADRRAMPGAPWLAQRVPHAELVVVPGATHLATLLGSWPEVIDVLLR